MQIYILLFSLICIFGYVFLLKCKDKKAFVVCSFFAMSLVLGLRGETVGEDTLHYLEVFDALSDLSWKTILTSGIHVVWDPIWNQKVELFYAILSKLISCFTGNGHVLIFVVSSLTCLLWGRFIYKNVYSHVFVATLFILCDSFFMGAFNAARQLLALAIIVNAYEFLASKEYGKILLISLTAFMVHNSAIVILLLYGLCTIGNRKSGVLLTCAAVVAVVLGFPLIIRIVSVVLPRYSVYFEVNYWAPNSLRGTLILWAVEIVISLCIFALGIKDQEEYSGIIGLLLYIAVELMGQRVVALGRLSYYFRFFTVMLFPSFIKRLVEESKLIFYFALITLFVMEYLSYAGTPFRTYSFLWS